MNDILFGNNNKAVINKIVKRGLKAEKRRNIMVIVAVMLAAFLISFAGIVSVSYLQMQENQVADTYEVIFSNITETDIEMLGELPEIARVGSYYLIDTKQSGQGYNASFLYADEAMMHAGRQQMKLIKGSLPKQANEIVISKSWIENYYSDAKVGDIVSLDIEKFQSDYIISGIAEAISDEASNTYGFIVSKNLIKQYSDYNAAGYRAYIHIKNSSEMNREEIKSYGKTVAREHNFSSPSFNEQYFRWTIGELNSETIAAIVLLGGLILSGGCIVIQSIFRISIIEKVQSFGQLRTIGATKKQIAKIVKKEGWQLGWYGILFGEVLGVLGAGTLLPKGFNFVAYAGVIIITALICRIMVSISIHKPIKIAAAVSPIEATHYTSAQKRIPHSRKMHKRLNPLSLALMNFNRDRKKVISILASLSLGGILLLVVSSLLLTYSPDLMARQMFPDGDYKVYIESETDLSDVLEHTNPLGEELKQMLLSVDGVNNIVVERQAAHGRLETKNNSTSGMCDMITETNYDEIAKTLVQGNMPSDGRSILVPSIYMDYFGDEISIGTTVQLALGKKSVGAVISGFFDLEKCTAGYGHGRLELDGAMMFLPDTLFNKLLPETENFDYSWEIISDTAKNIAVGAELQSIVASHSDIELDTYAEKVSSLESLYYTPFHILQGVSLVIFLFGVINLVNMTLSNHISRQHETSILRSVGLTKKQLYLMITAEGLCYALSSALLTFVIGLPIAILICHQSSLIVYGRDIGYSFPLLYMALYMLVLLILEFSLSAWTIHRQKKYSLIELLRIIE